MTQTNIWKSAALAAVLTASAGVAGAVPIAPGDSIDDSGFFLPNGGSLTFSYEVASPVSISGFTFGGAGFNSGIDLAAVTITIDGGTPFSFGNYAGAFPVTGDATAPGGVFSSDFDIVFDSSAIGTPNGTIVGVQFNIAAVPLPAAGLMLLSLLAAGGVASRCRKTAA